MRRQSSERLALEAEGIAELVIQLRAEETRLRATLERVRMARLSALAMLAAKAAAATEKRPTRRRRHVQK